MSVLNIYFVLILFFLDNVNSYGSYRDRIPNGYAIRHPCNGSPWGGVGHVRQGGGGPRNKFGLDYARYRDWRQICQLDSDGDGRTNGEELGDPQCVWTGGPAPATNAPITHPDSHTM
ncbi:hypothetical protein KUTeg_001637 [Tegillarca granosa]|uniref:Temptin Cys/Cys disulfide domain-containing protein n=1 Tax=Tegillarca granosa TaxID=220873 RepID=A0ABQ9FUV2_TEGGR|nr:hypothetical protein KUTeg_001637 [Tegillarca granosa]